MKMLTSLAAVAALIAGVSVATAQDSMGQSSMGGGSSFVNGTARYCLKEYQDGTLDCQYASLSACEEASTTSTTCLLNPHLTTGSSKLPLIGLVPGRPAA